MNQKALHNGSIDLANDATYNTRLQLTRIQVPGAIDIEYRFPTDTNNGRISSSKDNVTGEEVSYQYDELQRLISASTTGPEWGLTWTYDGFGNRLTQVISKGSAISQYNNVDSATNRLQGSGITYDANISMAQLGIQTRNHP